MKAIAGLPVDALDPDEYSLDRGRLAFEEVQLEAPSSSTPLSSWIGTAPSDSSTLAFEIAPVLLVHE